MEYTNYWEPLLLIVTCILIGWALGAYYMYQKMKDENSLLTIDLDMMKEKVHELLGHYNAQRDKLDEQEPSTKLDNTFKAQLQLKDDNLDRLNSLREQDQGIRDGLEKNLQVAASQILVLENRISKNKKVAIKRESELQAALTRIEKLLEEVDNLESNTEVKEMDTNTEIDSLKRDIKVRDRAIERKDKQIQELQSQIEDVDVNETGGYKRRKFIE